MAASVFDHQFVLLVILAVWLLRWLVEKGKRETQNTDTPPAPSQPISRGSQTQTEEERVRKFLEALGQPPGSAPPKASSRRRYVEPQVFPKLPRLKTAPPPLPASTAAPKSPPPLAIRVASAPGSGAVESNFEVHEVARQSSSEPAPAINRAALFGARLKLGTPDDLRTAIVLREIFGPPRSLQRLDLTTGSPGSN
ncbi:MAG TPA: hypothetical protein VGH00_06155 [Chthoniobacterales bacterium]